MTFEKPYAIFDLKRKMQLSYLSSKNRSSNRFSFSCILKRRDLVLKDKTLTCVDCGAEFVFTVNEQEFYKEKGFDNEPKRCPDCRKARKVNKPRRNF